MGNLLVTHEAALPPNVMLQFTARRFNTNYNCRFIVFVLRSCNLPHPIPPHTDVHRLAPPLHLRLHDAFHRALPSLHPPCLSRLNRI